MLTTWAEFKRAVSAKLIDELFHVNVPAEIKLSQALRETRPDTRSFKGFCEMTEEEHLCRFKMYLNIPPADDYSEVEARPVWYPYYRGGKLVERRVTLKEAIAESKVFWFSIDTPLSCTLTLFRNYRDTEFPRTYDIDPIYSGTLRRFLLQYGVEELAEDSELWFVFVS